MRNEAGQLEVEVKFQVTDIDDLRARIVGAGGIGCGRVFEKNFRFDDARGTLAKHSSLLRLRQDIRCTLTYKDKPSKADERFKIHNEYEVTVDDFDQMKQILENLGFGSQQTYQKWRETFVLGLTQLCIDSMPYGDFLEIEGDQNAIVAVSSRLGLLWEQRILLNYLEIFGIIKRHFALPFDDVTFENFASVQHDFASLIAKMRADRNS